MANRFRSTASSAFKLSMDDDNKITDTKNKALMKARESSKYKKTRRRQIKTKHATRDISINSDLDGDSKMIININKKSYQNYIPILVH